MPLNPSGWTPTVVERFIANRPTGASVVIVDTDQGEGFLKGLGNAAGPHALACELVGSLAADWVGLPTLDFAIIQIDETDELPLANGGAVLPGPAFISKKSTGFPWGGDAATLEHIRNKADLTRLVIFDTWVRNCDRHSVTDGRVRANRDNVFLLWQTDNSLRVIAMDHTHAFTCGRDVNPAIREISAVRDRRRFGLFPEFESFWDLAAASDTLARLACVDRDTLTGFIDHVPKAWQLRPEARAALLDFLFDRAGWLGSQNAASWMSEAVN